MNTQEAVELLNNGWVLKSHKDNFYGHLTWLRNPIHNGPGHAKYITYGVYKNLLKLGFTENKHMENTTVGTKTRLDLHGIRHEEARRQTIRFIEKNWGSTVDLKVITGHSQKMKQVVIAVIDEYKLEYRIGDYFGVDSAFITIPGGQ